MGGEEEIDLVDEQDNVVGSTTIGSALRTGQLHRAVAVLVIRRDGRYLLQQRSRRDAWHPGLWTLSSTGHVKKGETYEDAASRELQEELGITAGLKFVKKHLLPPYRSSGLTEHEWAAVYEAHTDLPCRADPVEVEGVKEVEEVELHRLMEGRSLTPDAVIILRDFLARTGLWSHEV